MDRWTISNTTLTYTDTIKMQDVYYMEQGNTPFVLPLEDTTSQLFQHAATDLQTSNNKLLIDRINIHKLVYILFMFILLK